MLFIRIIWKLFYFSFINIRNNRPGQSTRNGNPLSYSSNNANDRLKNVEGYYDTNNWGMTNSNWENTGSNHNYQENHNQRQNDSVRHSEDNINNYSL